MRIYQAYYYDKKIFRYNSEITNFALQQIGIRQFDFRWEGDLGYSSAS